MSQSRTAPSVGRRGQLAAFHAARQGRRRPVVCFERRGPRPRCRLEQYDRARGQARGDAAPRSAGGQRPRTPVLTAHRLSPVDAVSGGERAGVCRDADDVAPPAANAVGGAVGSPCWTMRGAQASQAWNRARSAGGLRGIAEDRRRVRRRSGSAPNIARHRPRHDCVRAAPRRAGVHLAERRRLVSSTRCIASGQGRSPTSNGSRPVSSR